jgi:thiol-disulfide isomerase/thioredoxin
LQALPSPIPIQTTPVPTVTLVPVLDELAPLDELLTMEGEAFTLGDYVGKLTVVNFWATWCVPCVEEMPLLDAYAAEHPNIAILALTSPDGGQTLDDIAAFIQTHQLDHLQIGLDQNNRLQLKFRALNLPMTFILDEQGYVRFRQIGQVTAADLDYYLNELGG